EDRAQVRSDGRQQRGQMSGDARAGVRREAAEALEHEGVVGAEVDGDQADVPVAPQIVDREVHLCAGVADVQRKAEHEPVGAAAGKTGSSENTLASASESRMRRSVMAEPPSNPRTAGWVMRSISRAAQLVAISSRRTAFRTPP